MNKIDERVTQIAEDKNDRRNFLKRIFKYAIGLTAFGIASLFGLKRSGEIRLGRMKDTEFGLSEAQGKCSYGADCAGGGGQCSYGADCAGGGGGGGGGQCSYGASCAGGGGKCSYGADCAGGGGKCSFGASCGGS